MVSPQPRSIQNRDYYFATAGLVKISLPLQGFWNCVVYIRPRCNALCRWRPNLPFHKVLLNILFNKEDPVDTSTMRRAARIWRPPPAVTSERRSKSSSGQCVLPTSEKAGSRDDDEEQEDEFVPDFSRVEMGALSETRYEDCSDGVLCINGQPGTNDQDDSPA